MWTTWANLFLSVWLIFSPLTFSYQNPPLVFSDVLSGILVGFFSISHLRSPHQWKKWGICLVGLWLLFAPLIFWTRVSGCYTNDTLVGTLLIILSVVFQNNPDNAYELPEGWSYNPSNWHHRIPVIILAFLGFFLARIMAAFQLGHIPSAWDPIFGKGTERVLLSDIAKSFPISDAGLGATIYLIEGLSGLAGDTKRWRTMPWMVCLFFILVVPAGVVSIVLIMLQPIMVGAWCTLCLATALVTLISIPPATDEIFATWQFLKYAHSKNKSLWKLFWFGDQTPEVKKMLASKTNSEPFLQMNGMGLPWNLFLSAVLGIWIIITPALFGIPKSASNWNYVMGALITTCAVLATAEPLRAVRFFNIGLALGISFLPFLINGMSLAPKINQIVAGLLLIFFSLPRGKIKEHYGSWDSYIF